MDSFSLTDHFLIAMPNMTDPHFAGAVVYLCEHSEHGAMGVVVNKPAEVTLGELFDQIDLPLLNPEQAGHPVYLGGPVQTDRGFVLHDPVVLIWLAAVNGRATKAVLEEALRTDYIDESEIAVLQEWRKDPANWNPETK